MVTIDFIIDNLDFFGTGLDQSAILIVLCILDTSLAISLRIKDHKGLNSQTFMAGVIHNFIPSLLPLVLYYARISTHPHLLIYRLCAVILFVAIGYFLVQSILANAALMGLDVKWLQNWLDHEIEEKKGSSHK